MRNKIDSYIKAKRSEMIEDILELIRIKSINGCAAENTEALNLFLQKAEAMGFKTMKTSTGDVGIVELGSGDQTLGILVHMDVVGIGDTDKWTYPPFEGRVAKGFLWGRGVVDDKGPAVMCLYALKAIKELEIPLNKRVWLIVGTSEEAEWTDIASFKKEFPVPDFGFSPDGDFPIYNSEKGYCDVQMRFMEPCIDILEKLDSGDSPNTIPSRAEVKIRNQENLVFHGISCHSSAPAIGINAISKMAVELGYRTEFNFIRFLNDFLAKDYNGEKLGMDKNVHADLTPTQRSIIVPTILKREGDKVLLNVNVRSCTGVSKEDVIAAFMRQKEKYSFEMELYDFLEPMFVDEKEEFLQVMAEVYADYGYESSFQSALGTSYAKSMKHFVSFGPVFDTEPSCAHMEDERMSITAMITATQIYTTYIATMASPIGGIRKNAEKMTSLEKALFLLSLFTDPPYHYDVPGLVELTGMNRTTVYRNLSTLEKAGLLQKDPTTKAYSLGPLAEKMGEKANDIRT